MFTPQEALAAGHLGITMGKRGSERKRPCFAASLPNLRMYFMHQHMEDSIVILNYVTSHHTQCEQFDMCIPWETLAAGHLGITMCKSGAERSGSARGCQL